MPMLGHTGFPSLEDILLPLPLQVHTVTGH